MSVLQRVQPIIGPMWQPLTEFLVPGVS